MEESEGPGIWIWQGSLFWNKKEYSTQKKENSSLLYKLSCYLVVFSFDLQHYKEVDCIVRLQKDFLGSEGLKP